MVTVAAMGLHTCLDLRGRPTIAAFQRLAEARTLGQATEDPKDDWGAAALIPYGAFLSGQWVSSKGSPAAASAAMAEGRKIKKKNQAKVCQERELYQVWFSLGSRVATNSYLETRRLNGNAWGLTGLQSRACVWNYSVMVRDSRAGGEEPLRFWCWLFGSWLMSQADEPALCFHESQEVRNKPTCARALPTSLPQQVLR